MIAKDVSMSTRIARICGELSPADSKTLHRFELEVPRGTVALQMTFGYEPVFSTDLQHNRRQVEQALREYLGEHASDPGLLDTALGKAGVAGCLQSLRNLLNWNLYEPSGRFRGRWDWCEEEPQPPVRVSSQASTRGFLDGPVPPGRWCVVLEVHLVCTPSCCYELLIEQQEAAPVTNSCSLRSPGSSLERDGTESSPEPAPLVNLRPGWLCGEMHAHSDHSDDRYSVAELARRACREGLAFVALTDHNTTSGHAEAEADSSMLFLRGEELTTFRGHFGLYGVANTVEWHCQGRARTIREIADELRAQGVLLSLAHPFHVGDPVCTGCRWPGDDPRPDRFDLLELWSGCWAERSVEIRRALALCDRWWDQGLAPVAIAGRDWHGPLQDDRAGSRFARTVVAAASPNASEVLKGLRRGAVYLSVGPCIDLWLEHRGARAGIGESLRVEPGAGARLVAELYGPVPRGSSLVIVRNGRKEAAWEVGRGPVRQEMAVHAPGRYRAEVWAADRELLLLSNHIVAMA